MQYFLFACLFLKLILIASGLVEKGELLFSDEFNYEGAPDSSKWYAQSDAPGENPRLSSCFTTKNVYASNGTLTIVIKKEKVNGKNYTAGAVWSRRGFRYGIFEMRARLGTGRGAWSNFWFLADNRKAAKWPADGEIDIAEVINTTSYQFGRIHASVHNDKFDNPIKNPSTYRSKNMTGSTVVKTANSEFHVYTLEFRPNRLVFYVDDIKFFKYDNDGTRDGWPFDDSMTLIINNKLGLPGDTFSGFSGINDDMLPLYHHVDYVRHYALPDIPQNDSIHWQFISYSNVTWAPGCDFPGSDFRYELTKIPVNNQCEFKCIKNLECTHFLWNDGICWMKKGKVSTADAVKSDPNMVCAILHR